MFLWRYQLQAERLVFMKETGICSCVFFLKEITSPWGSSWKKICKKKKKKKKKTVWPGVRQELKKQPLLVSPFSYHSLSFLFRFISRMIFPILSFFPLFPLSLLKATFAWIAKELPLMSVMSTDSYLYFLQKNKKAKPISAFVWCCIICDLCKYIPLKKKLL